MSNPFAEAYRYLRREYPNKGAYTEGVAYGAIACSCGAIAIGMPWLILAVAVTSVLSLALDGPEPGRQRGNSIELNGYQLVGEERDLNSILMTQKLIDGLTSKKKYLQDIPADLQKKIRQHTDDIQLSLQSVHVVKNGVPVTCAEFCFEREYFGTDGQKLTQKISSISTASMPRLSPAQEIKLLPAPVTSEFTQIALKVEKIEGRLEAIENPKPVDLDKAVFRKEL